MKCKCGNTTDFYRKDYAYGAIRVDFTYENGKEISTTIDELSSSLNYINGKLMYCGYCDKVVKYDG